MDCLFILFKDKVFQVTGSLLIRWGLTGCMVTGPGGVRLFATALDGLSVCSCFSASGIGKLIAGSDGVTCSLEDLTPFSALLLSSLDALSALSGIFLR